MGDLVERLLKPDYAKDMPLQREAAATITAMQGEIKRLSSIVGVLTNALGSQSEAQATIKRLEGERVDKAVAWDKYVERGRTIATLTAERDDYKAQWMKVSQEANDVAAHALTLTERVKELEERKDTQAATIRSRGERIKELEQQIEHLAGDGFTPGRITELEAGLSRQIEIANDHVADNVKLREALGKIASTDYVVENEVLAIARAAIKGER